MKSIASRSSQSGFTLIELIVVIVVLGILAATALPRFTDMSTDARIAKMRAGQAALQTGASLFHSSWLAAGSPSGSTGSAVSMEGWVVPYQFGYPDVGGDGPGFDSAAAGTTSGIVIAAGGLADYYVSAGTSSNTDLILTPDINHHDCTVVYYQSTTSGVAPVIDASGLTSVNCR